MYAKISLFSATEEQYGGLISFDTMESALGDGKKKGSVCAKGVICSFQSPPAQPQCKRIPHRFISVSKGHGGNCYN